MVDHTGQAADASYQRPGRPLEEIDVVKLSVSLGPVVVNI